MPRSSERTRTESAFVFRVGVEWYSLPTRVCERVIDESKTHSVPHRRGGVLIGLGSISGDLIAVISLPSLLGLDAVSTADEGRRTLLFSWKQSRFALPVSEVYGVYRFHPDDRLAIPATLPGMSAYTTAMLEWNGRMVGSLDPERLHAGIVKGIA